MAERTAFPMLRGYALPAQAGIGDHTYVTSEDGYIWPCWGRSSGGEEICAATGDSEIANCLSQPESHAGIVYLVTGVCHQTANRILHPADIVVDRAAGYRMSIALWEPWGLGNWPELGSCVSVDHTPISTDAVPRAHGGDGGHPEMEPIGRDGELRRRIKEIYSSIHDTIRNGRFFNVDQKALDGRPRLVRAMFDTFFGRDYDASKRQRVEALQATLRSKQDELKGKLAVGSLSPEDYFNVLTYETERTFRECERILGPAEFRELFGASPDAVKAFADKEVFLRSRRK